MCSHQHTVKHFQWFYLDPLFSPSAGWRWNCITVWLSVQNHIYTLIFYTLACKSRWRVWRNCTKMTVEFFLTFQSSPIIVLSKKKRQSLRTFSVHFPRETLDSCLDSINTAVLSCCLLGFGPEWRVDTPTWSKKTHVLANTRAHTHTPQPMVKPHQFECFWPFMDIHIHPDSEMKHHPGFLPEEKVTVEKKNK